MGSHPPLQGPLPSLTVLVTHALQFLNDAEHFLVTEHLHRLSPLLGPPYLPVFTNSHPLSEAGALPLSSSSPPQYIAISLGHHPAATASVLSVRGSTTTLGNPPLDLRTTDSHQNGWPIQPHFHHVTLARILMEMFLETSLQSETGQVPECLQSVRMSGRPSLGHRLLTPTLIQSSSIGSQCLHLSFLQGIP